MLDAEKTHNFGIPNLYKVGIEIFYLHCMKVKRLNDYILGDIKNIDFRDKVFDAVICISVLEHLSKE